MLQQQIVLSPDLKRLQDEGYEIEVTSGGYLIAHHIPYVNKDKKVKYGKLIVPLTINGSIAKYQRNCGRHVINFMGEYPCNKDGSEISAIRLSNPNTQLEKGIVMNWSFSNKPQNDYSDYYEQVTRYIEVISASAISLDSSVTAKTFKIVESENDDIFQYIDTNSSRANIYHINSKFRNQKIAIIGLGGTGSYILDLVAKTPVAEIHLYDSDTFLHHNAFRAPSAPSKQILELQKKKVEYFSELYSNMHKGIKPHVENVTAENVCQLSQMSFVFVCIDDDNARNIIIQQLLKMNVPLIDVGMGVQIVDDVIIGMIRTTVVTPNKYDHVSTRIPTGTNDVQDEYSTNIQIADLNALNAILAVIKWKKMSGFYQDMSKEYHSTYSTNDSNLVNDEKVSNS
jgi:hypothetical protein